MVALNLVLLAMIAYFGHGSRHQWRRGAARSGRLCVGAARTGGGHGSRRRRSPSRRTRSSTSATCSTPSKGAPTERSTSDAKRTDLNVKLWGTAVGADPSRSYAIIEDQAARRQALYRVGDSILDAATLLARVEWDRVVLDRNGDEEVLEMSSARGSATTGAAGSAGAGGSAAPENASARPPTTSS